MARAHFGLILAVALWLISPLSYAIIVPPLPQPSWVQLTAEQKHILAPLAADWDKISGFQRKKWIGIAQRYPSMNAEEQTRIQRRMTEWAKLTPEERKQARDKYLALQKAAPEKKESVKLKWQEYKELPESERTRLKSEAAKRTAPPAGVSKKPVIAKPPATANYFPPARAPTDEAAAR